MDFKKIIRETLTIKFDKAFGLDISDRSVEIIELEKVFRFSIKTYGRADIPSGIVENGKIVDPDALALRIKNLLREAKPHKVSTNKTIISLPESQVFISCQVVEVNIKSNNLEKIIFDKIASSLPIALDKLYWDFLQKPLPDNKNKLVIFVGVPKAIANGYVKFCNSIGLEVVSLNVESLSLARAILKKSDRQSLIVDIGARSTNLGFYDSNDKINMSVNIPIAGENFTEAIKTQLNVDLATAEELKIRFGFSDKPENNIRSAILPVYESLLSEIKSAIVYYEETFKQKLDDVYLIGGASLTQGLRDLMKRSLSREVQLVVSGNNINLGVLAEKGSSFSLFANVVGLGMLGASGEFQDMNLLKKMPKSEINVVDRLNLFKLGYLTRVNAFRMVLNNKYVLVTLIILIGVIFAVLLQQTESFGFASTSAVILDNKF